MPKNRSRATLEAGCRLDINELNRLGLRSGQFNIKFPRDGGPATLNVHMDQQGAQLAAVFLKSKLLIASARPGPQTLPCVPQRVECAVWQLPPLPWVRLTPYALRSSQPLAPRHEPLTCQRPLCPSGSGISVVIVASHVSGELVDSSR